MRQTTNVLLVNDHLGWNGATIHGVGRFFLNVLRYYDATRYNIIPCILGEKDSLNDIFEERGINIKFLNKGKFDPSTILSLMILIKKEHIDVLHLHGYRATTFGRMAGLLTGVPVILHAHETDLDSYRWYMRIPDYILGKYTHRAIAVASPVRESLIKKRYINPGSIIVLHNALSLEEFELSSEDKINILKNSLGIPKYVSIIGTISSLLGYKGIEYLVRAAEQVLKASPNTIFVIVGEGPLRGELTKLAGRLDISKQIIFTGFQRDVRPFLSMFDVQVIPSIHDFSPHVALEGMAMGKTIVSTGVDGLKEILTDNKTALLVPPRDSNVLAERILFLLENKHVAEQLGLNAKLESKKYDIKAYARKLGQLYDELALKSKSSN